MNSQAINSTLNDRISAFAKAGSQLSHYLKQDGSLPKSVVEQIDAALHLTRIKNSWFDTENIHHAVAQCSQALTTKALQEWMEPYHISNITSKTIGIITAGNIPLVGFHDVLSVILVGHHALIKNSSNDDVLTKLILELATTDFPELMTSYSYIDGKLENYDAVIATGSNNTARYFEYYFGKVPHIIRKNRNSVAIISGDESPEEMEALSEDVFRYYGLGCRSVSHIKVPIGYNFDHFFNGMYKQRHLIKNEKYVNNYDYNKAVYLMSDFDLLDNEFLLIKEETESYSSPIASVGYAFYDSTLDIINELKTNADQLQCVVAAGKMKEVLQEQLKEFKAPQVVENGMTQQPALNDYADGVDTVNFLLTLS